MSGEASFCCSREAARNASSSIRSARRAASEAEMRPYRCEKKEAEERCAEMRWVTEERVEELGGHRLREIGDGEGPKAVAMAIV